MNVAVRSDATESPPTYDSSHGDLAISPADSAPGIPSSLSLN